MARWPGDDRFAVPKNGERSGGTASGSKDGGPKHREHRPAGAPVHDRTDQPGPREWTSQTDRPTQSVTNRQTDAADTRPAMQDDEIGATYRDVFQSREFRYLFSATMLSLIGDQLAKIALSILVFQRTSSTLLTALSFGISYAPWILGGPILSTFADRLPRRQVMIFCDCGRMLLVALLAVPGIPIPALLVVLLAASMFTPPFESARSALTTQMLTGDRYVVGNGLSLTGLQIGNVVGLLAGGALVALISARGALLIDAGTFAISAVLIVAGVIERRPAAQPRGSAWHEISAGGRLVFGDARLRAIVLIVWLGSGCTFAWEGIAAPWAHGLGGGARTVGLLLGVSAVGAGIGSVVIGRLCPPRLRRKLILPLAVAAPGLLGIFLIGDHLAVAIPVLLLSGFGAAFAIPLNAIFMQALPSELRGRAFGVAQGGLQVSQGLGVLVAGALAGTVHIGITIGLLGLVGAAAALCIGLLQPIKPTAQPA
jgi:predicted MFS family arabinose efflux permease